MEVTERLRAIPLFSELSPEQLQELATVCQAQRFVAGEDIIQQGDLTNRFFIVDDGFVNFRKTDNEGYEHPSGSAAPGQFFGLKMFTSQEPFEYTVEAVGQAALYVIERNAFDQLLITHPELLEAMPEIETERSKLTRGYTWLSPGEVIELFTRRHWWALFLGIRWPLIIGLVLLAILIGTNYFGWATKYGFVNPLLGILILGAVLWGLWQAGDFFADDFVVTNKRVVLTERIIFISEDRHEIPIEHIQSIVVSTGGPISVLFGIHNLQIQSASVSTGGIVFDHIANAEEIRQVIVRQQAEMQARQQAIDRERLRGRLGRSLRHYVLKEGQPEGEVEESIESPDTVTRERLIGFWQRLFGTEFHSGHTITWRKHPIILLRQTGLWLLILIVLVAVTGADLAVPALHAIPQTPFFAAVGVIGIIVFGIFLWQWEDWRVDLYQLSDNDIVDINSLPFGLNYSANHAQLSKIQDVRSERPRYINTALNFGNVIATVGGDAPPFTFNSVSAPNKVSAEIFRRLNAFKVRERERAQSAQSRELIDALVAYHRLLMADRHNQGEITLQVNPPMEDDGSSQLPAQGAASPNQLTTGMIEPRQSNSSYEEGGEFPPADEYEE